MPFAAPPPSRDEQLRTLLHEHRLHRARIESTHDAAEDLSAQLAAALQRIARLDAEFNKFREGANQRLENALEDNRKLKLRVKELGGDGGVKPSERMLSVEALRARKAEVEVPKRRLREIRPAEINRGHREVEPLGGKENDIPQGFRRSLRLPRSFSRKWSTCF